MGIAFTKVRDIQKISEEDVITTHRLLKNSIDSDEYMLVTDAFIDRSYSFDKAEFKNHVEHIDGLGSVHGLIRNFEPVEADKEAISPWQKFKFLMKVES